MASPARSAKSGRVRVLPITERRRKLQEAYFAAKEAAAVIKPVLIIGRACRLCKTCNERIGHLPFCATLKPIWDRFFTLVRHQHGDAQPTHRLLLLAYFRPPRGPQVSPSGRPQCMDHTKFIILRFNIVDLEN